MKKYIFIGIGGFLGAVSRFIIKNIQINWINVDIPINTLLINITGSFLIGIILTISMDNNRFNEDVRTGISAGFLGAYTTFSTFCKELVDLICGGKYYAAFAYILLSQVLGLFCAYKGIKAGRKLSKPAMFKKI